MKRSRSILLGLLALVWMATPARCGEKEPEHLLHLGIKMFPILVGGNMDLEVKQNADGKLLLLVVYHEDPQAGQQIADKLQKTVTVIYKYAIRATATDLAGADALARAPVAGVFVAEKLPENTLQDVIRFGIHHKSVVFSPFEGDVARGVMAGLHIATQVQPALNLTTLHKAGLRMNKLLLKMAKTYE